MRIGHPGQALLQIPGSQGRAGAIVIGGLNPVAILEEIGIRAIPVQWPGRWISTSCSAMRSWKNGSVLLRRYIQVTKT